MVLLRHYLRGEIAELQRNGVRLKVIGQLTRLAPDIVGMIARVETLTRENSQITLTIALSYGGRAEIVAAVQAIAAEVARGSLAAEDVDEDCLARHLFTADIPDSDLLIRPSSEECYSYIFFWQCAYSVLVFTLTLCSSYSKSCF